MSTENSSVMALLELAENMRHAGTVQDETGNIRWLLTTTRQETNSIESHADNAIHELAWHISSVGGLLATHDPSAGMSDSHRTGLGWLVCLLGELVSHCANLEAQARSGIPCDEASVGKEPNADVCTTGALPKSRPRRTQKAVHDE